MFENEIKNTEARLRDVQSQSRAFDMDGYFIIPCLTMRHVGLIPAEFGIKMTAMDAISMRVCVVETIQLMVKQQQGRDIDDGLRPR